MSNRRKLRKPIPESFVSTHREMPSARWNGEPVKAARVKVLVALPATDTNTWHPMSHRQQITDVRKAVRVTYAGRTFYIDDEDGSGSRKVLNGGSPRYRHREITIIQEVSNA